MKKRKAKAVDVEEVEIFEMEIDLMSLVELGANHTQVEGGKTVLLMKSAARIEREKKEQENGMTEREKLEARRTSLRAELAIVESTLIKDEEGEGEGNEPDKKPADEGTTDDAGTEPAETETGTATDKPDKGTGEEKVAELEQTLAGKDEEITGLKAEVAELTEQLTAITDGQDALESALDGEKPDKDAEEE